MLISHHWATIAEIDKTLSCTNQSYVYECIKCVCEEEGMCAFIYTSNICVHACMQYVCRPIGLHVVYIRKFLSYGDRKGMHALVKCRTGKYGPSMFYQKPFSTLCFWVTYNVVHRIN